MYGVVHKLLRVLGSARSNARIVAAHAPLVPHRVVGVGARPHNLA
jgi:hypothetical protein